MRQQTGDVPTSFRQERHRFAIDWLYYTHLFLLGSETPTIMNPARGSILVGPRAYGNVQYSPCVHSYR